MIDTMNLAILIGAGLVALSAFTSLISLRVGAPLLLLFLLVGLAAGENGVGGLHFDNAPVAYFIGSLALAIILFESGFETNLRSYRVAGTPALLLATVGVLITSALLAILAWLLLDLTWIESLLLGAIISSTDAAAVFLLMRVGGVGVRERVGATLEIESATNDPMAVFLTISLVELAVAQAAGAGAAGGTGGLLAADASTAQSIVDLLILFLKHLLIGGLGGLGGGLALGWLLRRLRLDPALLPIVAICLALVLFAGIGLLGGSGFLAIYLAGLTAGNMNLPNAARLRRFQAGLTWLAQIGMFVTLGLLATPSQFPDVAVPAVLLALFLIFVARPLAVWLCLAPMGFSRNEILFVGWVGLRGAVSILLAIVPFLYGLPEGRTFFNVVFIMVLASLLLQGWTVMPLARRLGLVLPPRQGPVDRVELDLPGDAMHELVAYGVRPDSPIARGELIPRWARPSLVIRNGKSLSIHSSGPLQVGDRIYLFVAPKRVPLLDKLFAGLPVAEEDREFFGDFPLAPASPLGQLAVLYGADVPASDAGLQVAAYCQRELGGTPAVGDRLSLGSVELVVRAVGRRDEILELGLALEAAPAPDPLPGQRTLRALWNRLRRPTAAFRSGSDSGTA
jgi:potassium/hydrogen antiporter